MDYDFDWFVIEFEYCQNPDKEFPPNENDRLYLAYCELLMQAKEAGLGFRVEWENTLYLAPTPLVKINTRNAFHSDRGAAIRWKGADEYHFLNGIKFDQKLWEMVVSRTMTFDAVMRIRDVDQRTQAMKYISFRDFLAHTGAKKLDAVEKMALSGAQVWYELWEVPESVNSPFNKTVHYVFYNCPSTNNEYGKGVPEFRSVADAMGWAFQMPADEWKRLVPLGTES